MIATLWERYVLRLYFLKDPQGCMVVAKSIIREDNIDEWGYSQTSIRMKMERDIFWNIDKEIKISLGDRESAPMLTKMYESLEDVIHFDCMDGGL